MTESPTRPDTSLDVGGLVTGIIAVAVGAAVIPYGAGMPDIREGIPGPGLFPMMIGGLAILFGLLLIASTVISARRRRALAEEVEAVTGEVPAVADASAPEDSGALVETGIGAVGARRWINGAVVFAAIVFYIVAAEPLGFPLTMFVVTAAIMLTLRAKVWVALVTGAGAAVGLWALFELGLLVQLPDGPIAGF